MLKEGFIVDIQHRSAKLAPLVVVEKVDVTSNAEHVSAEVKRQLLNDPQFAILGNTKEERITRSIQEIGKDKKRSGETLQRSTGYGIYHTRGKVVYAPDEEWKANHARRR